MAALAVAFGKIVRYEEYVLLGEDVDPFVLAAIAAVIMFVLVRAALSLYLSLVRRLKCHMFWRGALIWRLGRQIRKGFLSLYENSSIVSRELIPFFVIVLFNLCMGLFGGVIGILACGIVDVAAACLLYLERKDLQSIVDGTRTIGEGRFDAKIDGLPHARGEPGAGGGCERHRRRDSGRRRHQHEGRTAEGRPDHQH